MAPMRGPHAPRSPRPPLWREARLGLEAAGLMRDPVFRGREVPAGRGRPVMLIPGFLAGDGSLVVMADWLRRCGYRPSRAGMVANVDCSGAVLTRLEARLERLAERARRTRLFIGQSRGGGLARALACRRPELVAWWWPWARLSSTRSRCTRSFDCRYRRSEAGLPRSAPAVQALVSRERVLRRLLGGRGHTARGRHALRVDLLAQRRHSRLARLPRSTGRERGGPLLPLRHGRERRGLPRRGGRAR